MKVLSVIVALASMNIYATTCDVYDYMDAISCIEKDSYERHGEGEEKHSVGVTRFKKGKEAFKTMTGKETNAHYVGVVEVHYDEDLILYYEIEKGKNVAPVFVKEYNIVELVYDPPEELKGMEEKGEIEIISLFIPLKNSMEGFHL